MYAVIKSGGKQYRVASGDVIKVERLNADVGETIELPDVLMIGSQDEGGEARVGAPRLEGASVTAQVLDQIKTRKIIVFKKKRRKNYRRTGGHRQQQTVLRIRDIAVA